MYVALTLGWGGGCDSTGGGCVGTGAGGGRVGTGARGGRVSAGTGCGCGGTGTGSWSGGRIGGFSQTSSITVMGNALMIPGQDYKIITCGWCESSDSVRPIFSSDHSLSIPPHHKPSDPISVIDPIWCRVPPRESNGGSSAACYHQALWWPSGNWEGGEKNEVCVC